MLEALIILPPMAKVQSSLSTLTFFDRIESSIDIILIAVGEIFSHHKKSYSLRTPLQRVSPSQLATSPCIAARVFPSPNCIQQEEIVT